VICTKRSTENVFEEVENAALSVLVSMKQKLW